MKLKISPEYSSLLTPLSDDEYEGLKKSINDNGQFLPIITNDVDIILDGHTRNRICEELGIEPLVKKISLRPDEEIDYVVSVNANRRQLNPITMVILASRKYGDGKGDWEGKNETELAFEFGCSKGTFHRARQIVKHHGPEKAIELMKKEGFSFGKEYDAVIREKKKLERRIAFQDASPQKAKLFCDDFQKVGIPPASIDVIITDPPYPHNFLSLFNTLSVLAGRWLKPKGSLLVMSGQMYLPTVFELLGGKELQYYWTLGYLMPGGTNLIHGRPVQSGWKPILWYVKDVKYHDDMPIRSDLVTSRKSDKELDEWQQSVSGMCALVEWCTNPGDVVLDPMMGRGTTGVAAIKLKRKFIGIDNDPEAFKDAQGRIAEAERE